MRTFYSLLIIILVLSCSENNPKGYNVEAKVSPDYNGKTATLVTLEKGKPNIIDSSVVAKGEFNFNGRINSPDMYYLAIDSIRGNLPFILENTDYTITIDTDSIFKSDIKGGEEHMALEKFKTVSKSIRDGNIKLGKEVRIAQMSRDTARLSILRKTYDSLNEENSKINKIFIKDYNDKLVSALILENLIAINQIDSIKAQELYTNFSDKVKNTRAGKSIDSLLGNSRN